jgi:hypothetical protein
MWGNCNVKNLRFAVRRCPSQVERRPRFPRSHLVSDAFPAVPVPGNLSGPPPFKRQPGRLLPISGIPLHMSATFLVTNWEHADGRPQADRGGRYVRR